MCKHYSQNEISKVRAELKSIGKADENAAATLPRQWRSSDKLSVFFECHLYYQSQNNHDGSWTNSPLHSRDKHFPHVPKQL